MDYENSKLKEVMNMTLKDSLDELIKKGKKKLEVENNVEEEQ